MSGLSDRAIISLHAEAEILSLQSVQAVMQMENITFRKNNPTKKDKIKAVKLEKKAVQLLKAATHAERKLCKTPAKTLSGIACKLAIALDALCPGPEADRTPDELAIIYAHRDLRRLAKCVQ